MNFFRLQAKGIPLSAMKRFNSGDGGDGHTKGLCVSDAPDQFGGAWQAFGDDDGEVVVLQGTVLARIYDGYRIRPTKEVARFTKGKWRRMIESGEAWNYEDWS